MNEAVLQNIEEHALTPEAIEQVVLLSEREDAADQRTPRGLTSCLRVSSSAHRTVPRSSMTPTSPAREESGQTMNAC
jgi:hypothetical protein